MAYIPLKNVLPDIIFFLETTTGGLKLRNPAGSLSLTASSIMDGVNLLWIDFVAFLCWIIHADQKSLAKYTNNHFVSAIKTKVRILEPK